MIDSVRVLALWESGASDHDIARALDTDANLIWAWRKRRGLKANFKAGGKPANENVRPTGNNKKKKPNYMKTPSDNSCVGCLYWVENRADHDRYITGYTGYCEYILINYRRRPCPPGAACTVRQDAGRGKTEIMKV